MMRDGSWLMDGRWWLVAHRAWLVVWIFSVVIAVGARKSAVIVGIGNLRMGLVGKKRKSNNAISNALQTEFFIAYPLMRAFTGKM